ncbi:MULTISPECIES: SsgA family sporulation/cell division regulator [Streptomyces]|uniref:SsgA family sporulation/cell division regulator n=1 Tax=Streptomyces sudanensis TaxID=436397 RepID=A0ABY4TFD6_9ACTN|nr:MULTISPECIES: SsgA family sporulation/cell division regulator [Streptomyces]MCP9956504.1 SsgA family sporulation/cell division regulator [Streptomyces sudanensis]MCP9985703.1 SsgA family sporulation/cell division regulator [Streptomyces sudanensis]MCQ0002888.1 SsgA family sporulation/cell division regulator [Streptomyces sudanensis]URN17646.1 SsgA family sporulation/cell division regulator [Streptomyces sudanensis]
MSTVIEQPLQARLVASAPRVDVVSTVLRYDPADPFAVHMAFPAPATLEGVETVWGFSRELLAAGTDAPAGDGDVRVRPFGHGRTVVEFHAAEGVAMVHVHTDEVRRFLRRTERAVPAGHESRFLDLDRGLARLLRDPR